MTITPLSTIKPGQAGTVKKINGTGPFFTRLRAMGLRQNVEMQVLQKAPFGGPLKVKIMGCDLAFGRQEAEQILVAIA
jgi:Fe2+ transport system protein FeoA